MRTTPWRSLEELAGTRDFRAWLEREFPPAASEWPEGMDRRRFLEIMGASLALAGIGGCTRQPLEQILPYVRQPEELIPGRPLYFATALTFEGYARGVLVESHEGRPTKIEGNPDHPASLGASDIFMQADILTLYDPDRSQQVTKGQQRTNWTELVQLIQRERQKWKENGGLGLRLLTGYSTSPTLLEQIGTLLKEFPRARWHTHEPLIPARRQPFYDLARADVIVSLNDDFLGPGPAQLRYVRDFSARRRSAPGAKQFNRLYVAESTPTLTGARADHRIRLSPRALQEFGVALARGAALPDWGNAIRSDLTRHPGRSLILAADSLPEELKQFARDWNRPLQVAEAAPLSAATLRELTQDLELKNVEALVILGGNPVYDAPADLQLADKLRPIPLLIRLGLYEDETSALCHWHVPESHPLEAWSDARAFDGTVSIIQPLIEPLYGSRSNHELVAALAGNGSSSGYEIVRQHWLSQQQSGDFDRFWRKSLHDGLIAGAAPPASPNIVPEVETYQRDQGLEIEFRPSPTVLAGQYANNAWLQELPQPITKLTWGNAALVSPTTAKQLQLATGDIVDLKYRGRVIRGPVCVVPGQSDSCVTLHLGYGRTHVGRVGNGVGFNANAIRTSDAPWGGGGLEILKTGKRQTLATTQGHQSMEGRDLIRVATIADFDNDSLKLVPSDKSPKPAESLYPAVAYKGHAWGMAIDLGACIGCNVCTIACQAENSIPVVGADQVARGRIMHWIRVDTYFEGSAENPALHFQPVPCMHCENAPCELVCPVAATVHSSEGINQMVYNRCIGTRYCSNNCPYKVRRFNFLEYGHNRFEQAPILKLLRNPDVTVRSRGVMEKCTYCVQRINRVRLESQKQNRTPRDGEIVPACAQACPAEAIVFGDINDPQSRVSALKASRHNYDLLGELNNRPRTTYLAKLVNPNPAMKNP